ncbi:hypothetical protein LZ633_11905 [Enterobacter asburiae]|nr:hypothetical protein [Enterobacter asburiae]
MTVCISTLRHDADLGYITQRTTAGITERFTRRATGELTSWQLNDHAPLTLEHDPSGQELTRRSDAGFSLRQRYTPAGLLAEQQTGDATLRREWLYDKAYNLTMLTDSLRGTMVNSLTLNDQISHATWTGSTLPVREERFTYDKNLNVAGRQTWLNAVMESEAHQRQTHGRVTSHHCKEWRHTTSRINPDSGMPESGRFVRVIRDERTTWKYDVNGRLVEKQVDKGGYRWDAKSQLTGLETPEGERLAYRYDPFGRRISKRCINRDRPGTDFHWNGDQLTEEIPVGTDGTPVYENAIRWIYEPGSFTPLARHENGELHYAVTDTLGRIQELLREDGALAWRGEQQLWGRETGRQKADAPACRLRFPGQYEDAESGLYYNRFRYYDADSGQYLCADPIGLDGGINPYGYVSNPLKYIDPLGLCKANIRQLDPSEIRFSQNSVNGTAELVKSMKTNGWRGDPIDVVRMADGKLTTIDNTRVLAASRAGIKVAARIHNASDTLPPDLAGRFTTKKGTPSTWGEAIDLRIGKQSAGYRNHYPNGSNIIGALD